jgi:hypothetical protein
MLHSLADGAAFANAVKGRLRGAIGAAARFTPRGSLPLLSGFDLEVEMSVWHAHEKTRLYPTHAPTLQEIAIFAGGLFVAVMVGIAASGVLPLV